MKKFVSLAVFLVIWVGSVNAYPTRVAVEECARGSANKVAVLSWQNIRVDGSYTPKWQLRNGQGETTAEIQFQFIEQTISIVRTIPPKSGFSGDRWTFSSLDPLHFDNSKRYDARVFTTSDFLWFELGLAGATVTPIYSTVFFVGAPEDLVSRAIDGESTSSHVVGCTNYESLKADVQKNYADGYDPKDVRMIQYTLDALGAVGAAVYPASL